MTSVAAPSYLLPAFVLALIVDGDTYCEGSLLLGLYEGSSELRTTQVATVQNGCLPTLLVPILLWGHSFVSGTCDGLW